MGSWANTLFVKADNAAAVASEIQSMLLDRGLKLSTAPAKSQIGPGWMARQDESLVAEFLGPSGSPNDATRPGEPRCGHSGSAGARRRGGPSFGSNGHASQTPFGAGDFAEDEFDDEFDDDLNVEDFDDDGERWIVSGRAVAVR